MTTPPTFRAVLTEIPDRLEGLQNDVVMDGPVLGNIQLDNEVANMSLNQLDPISPVPSPDELMIRQRGRRVAQHWSPNNVPTPARSPFQRTPTKVITNGMILRSSPRKRLSMVTKMPMDHLYNGSPVLGGKTGSERASPRKQQQQTISPLAAAKTQLWPGTPTTKKIRIEERPLAQLNNDTPLDVLLMGLSQTQLVAIIGQLVNGDVKREDQLRNELPLPDISHMEQTLLLSKRNIFKSLPTSRLCRKTDSSAYARAVTHLSEFKRILMSQAQQLYDATHWDALLDYVTMAWPYVRSTPVWDNVVHNTVRRQCFKVLSCHCIAAVKKGGMRLGVQRLHALEYNLNEWMQDYEDVLSCVNVLNKTLLKSRNTL